MELINIARILLRRWWLIAIPVIITAVWAAPDILNRGTTSAGFSTVIHYSAAQQPEAMPPRDGDFQDIWLASELTVNALTAWVQTGSFRQEIALKAAGNGLQIDPAAIGIAADNERSIGQLFLSWPDAGQLAIIAQAALDVLAERNLVYFPQMGSAPAAVTILDEPSIVPSAPPLANRFAPFIRIGLGVLAGIGLAFLAHYLDPTLRRREDVEQLGLLVIASLPKE
jgi:hypothetical protein